MHACMFIISRERKNTAATTNASSNATAKTTTYSGTSSSKRQSIVPNPGITTNSTIADEVLLVLKTSILGVGNVSGTCGHSQSKNQHQNTHLSHVSPTH
uniref:Uncharacterized protein n=1 Tax=Glycine max TaxID=3847 RepID=C6TKF5_SOYBN|nr:unknown [Glycine max]